MLLTDKLAEREVSLFSVMAKTKESDKWAASTPEELLAVINRQGYTARHVVITGGEPCIHDLTPLTQLLEQHAYIERHNRTMRYSWVSKHLFDTLEEVQNYATKWL
ncbi:hypothetical protein A9B99_16115 [Mangrovibacter phragmitis]|uniref:7-carboxy-7-deazaguanine synthase n=1 Tax=Mangrovibacter phragmitis TaxID=1691903 RepID=A0A1B7KYZ5_9ENTR|nr:hypothetical protein A9B99_16115 [Mangrovibacter phragmitis]